MLLNPEESIPHASPTEREANEARRLKATEGLTLTQFSSAKELLDLAIEEIIGLSGSQFGYIYHYFEEKKDFVLHAWSKGVLPQCAISEAPTIYHLERTGVWGEAVRQRKAIVLNDFQAPHPLKRGYPAGHAPLHRFLTVPVFAEGRIVAVAGVANKEQPYTTDDVQQLHQFMVSVWNMTARKMREAEITENEYFFRESQRAGRIGSYTCDFVSGTWRSSEVLDGIFGIELDFPHTVPGWLDLIHTDDRERMTDHLVNQVLAQGLPFDAEYRIVRPADGSVRWVHGLGSTSKDGSGQVVTMIGTIQDITERKTVEEQLRQHEKLTAIGQLAGGIAHDFNNQLAVIVAQTEMIKLMDSPDQRNTRLDRILAAAKRASDLTRQLLTFARKMPLRNEQFDPNRIVRETAEILERSGDRRIQVVLHTRATRAVEGDPSLLQNAVLNLALNARDAMPRGGTLTISSCDTEGAEVAIEVADTGTGIAPENLDRIFEPFFSTKPPGQGTGLGLATVQGAVTQMGGRVEVRSVVGQGSVFRLTLPSVDRGAPSSEAAPTRTAPALRVVLVDDDDDVREATQQRLGGLGHQVKAFGDGAAALKHLQTGTEADLVLLDMNMPKMNGADVLEGIRRVSKTLPVVIVSGNITQIPASVAQDPGVKAVLQKPLMAEDLGALGQYLGRPDGGTHGTR